MTIHQFNQAQLCEKIGLQIFTKIRIKVGKRKEKNRTKVGLKWHICCTLEFVAIKNLPEVRSLWRSLTLQHFQLCAKNGGNIIHQMSPVALMLSGEYLFLKEMGKADKGNNYEH